ncbi:MAG: ABC transporter ATP-binding protein [Eubacteriales bacterium]|nr:ABC transporter ATP-binding protein [Eubacteriales bacterium]MDD4422365.1 ABC transporter ATP-binding protein [Eubacteriales bacterium]HBR30917.1 ABC transporter ATP-binding protein [Clostridiales bacterium]
MLEIRNYSKSYGNKVAVKNLTLTIENGDIYGFIGHNGAGKTTTIKAITGIMPIEQGDILLDGVSVKRSPTECKKKMAYIPDTPDIYESMSGLKFIKFICDIYEVPVKTRENNIKKYAESFEMLGDLTAPISSYSHGMRQKINIIAALAHEPKLMVLDEPFVGLDPKAAHILKEYMRQMCSTGASIFFSTHVLEVAEKLCNKIAIIKSGELIRSGPIAEVRGDSSLEDIFLELSE